MESWKERQDKLILIALNSPKSEIIEEEVDTNNLNGVLFYKKNFEYKRAVVLAPGMGTNRYGLSFLAKTLAHYGILCFGIDPTSHYRNKKEFTLGAYSEDILKSIAFIRKTYKIEKVGLVGHSMGAVCGLFSNAGYTKPIENELIKHHIDLFNIVEKYGEKLRKDFPEEFKLKIMIEFSENFEKIYENIKKASFQALECVIKNDLAPTCNVFVSPVVNTKSALSGLSFLTKMKFKYAKFIFELIVHKPFVKQVAKEHNAIHYEEEKDPQAVYWGCFKQTGGLEFLLKFLSLHEPLDFLSLLEFFSNLKEKDEKITFFTYYRKHFFQSKPKLFIYGKYDLLMKTFLPYKRKKAENFYKKCGHAEIYCGNFSHPVTENRFQVNATVNVTRKEVVRGIMKFLDRQFQKRI